MPHRNVVMRDDGSMVQRMRIVAALGLALGASACSASTESTPANTGSNPVPSVSTPTSIEPVSPGTDVAVADPAATGSAGIDPVGSDLADGAAADSTSPTSSSAAPSATPAAAVPTSATTTAYVGSDSALPWAAIATWDGSAWLTASFDTDGVEIDPPESDFDAVAIAGLGLENPVTGLTFGPQDYVCLDDRMGPTVVPAASIPDVAGPSGYRAVAVAGDWPLQPRPVAQIGLDVAEYQQIGEDFAAAAGVDGSAGDVVQVVRVDLDGNGVDEVLVTFERVTDGFGTVGDLSIVYARYPTSSGDVVDEVLFEYYPSDPASFPTVGAAGLMAVADLNGDGVMEVVLRSSFWESIGAGLYSFVDGRLVSVAETGCGV